MFAVLDWLTTPLGAWGSQTIVVAGVLGALALVLGEVAVARGIRWAWPVASVVCAAFAVLALTEARFVDAGIRLVLASLCAYGWRVRSTGAVHKVRAATSREAAYGVVLFAITTVVAAYALTDQSDDAASWGSAVIVAALFLQVAALARGLVSGWWVALGGAAVSLALAVIEASWATACVAALGAVVAWYGSVRWRREAVMSAALALSGVVDEVGEDLLA